MNEKEILELFRYRYLNSKTNNYIFTEVEDFDILKSIPENCMVSISECNIDINRAINIKIDFKKISVRDIITYSLNILEELNLLDSFFDYNIDFNDKFDLIKFQYVLRNYDRIVQLIFYNIDKLSLEEQMLFNEIYYFDSIYFNANAFIKENNFQSYFLSGNRVLDDRENYTKIKMLNRM